MHRHKHLPFLVSIACALWFLGGCNKTAPEPKTPVEWFRAKQADVKLTEGRTINISTVEEKDSKIYFTDSTNRRWRVGYTKQADGTYSFSTPEPVP